MFLNKTFKLNLKNKHNLPHLIEKNGGSLSSNATHIIVDEESSFVNIMWIYDSIDAGYLLPESFYKFKRYDFEFPIGFCLKNKRIFIDSRLKNNILYKNAVLNANGVCSKLEDADYAVMDDLDLEISTNAIVVSEFWLYDVLKNEQILDLDSSVSYYPLPSAVIDFPGTCSCRGFKGKSKQIVEKMLKMFRTRGKNEIVFLAKMYDGIDLDARNYRCLEDALLNGYYETLPKHRTFPPKHSTGHNMVVGTGRVTLKMKQFIQAHSKVKRIEEVVVNDEIFDDIHGIKEVFDAPIEEEKEQVIDLMDLQIDLPIEEQVIDLVSDDIHRIENVSISSIVVGFTGYRPTTEEQIQLQKLNIEIELKSTKFTMLIAPKISLTTKFLNARVMQKPICSPEWLKELVKTKKVPKTKNHLLNDPDKEYEFEFNLHDGKFNILEGWFVMSTPNVKIPFDLQEVVRHSGGQMANINKILNHEGKILCLGTYNERKNLKIGTADVYYRSLDALLVTLLTQKFKFLKSEVYTVLRRK